MTRRRPYKHTTVSVAVTQSRDITGLFEKYDIEAWQFSTHRKAQVAQVRFALQENQWVRVTLKARIEEGMTEKQVKSATRAAWRALYHWLKTQLEATFDFGLFRKEEAFLSWLELAVDGRVVTVADELLPRLGEMPRLLGSGS